MKMIILEIGISFLLGLAVGFGGNWLLVYNSPPKTNIVNVNTENHLQTEQRTEVSTYQIQSQVTAIDSKGFTNFSINSNLISNISKSLITNTNWNYSKTN